MPTPIFAVNDLAVSVADPIRVLRNAHLVATYRFGIGGCASGTFRLRGSLPLAPNRRGSKAGGFQKRWIGSEGSDVKANRLGSPQLAHVGEIEHDLVALQQPKILGSEARGVGDCRVISGE